MTLVPKELDGLDSIHLKEMINVYGVDTVMYWCLKYADVLDDSNTYFLKHLDKSHRRIVAKADLIDKLKKELDDRTNY